MIAALLGTKLGMSHIYDDDGRYVPVTVISAGPCVVSQIKSRQADGYDAAQLAYGKTREQKLSNPELGHLEGLGAFNHLREFRVSPDELDGVERGQEITVAVLADARRVKIVGTSKGRGFTGVMKRHGFRGGRRTHGQSDRERAPGSIGAGTDPGRVFKGKKMAGRSGGRRTTLSRVKVVRVDSDRNLLLLSGAVPGPNGSLLAIEKVS
jgi:large subunit ribosomal protein L3